MHQAFSRSLILRRELAQLCENLTHQGKLEKKQRLQSSCRVNALITMGYELTEKKFAQQR